MIKTIKKVAGLFLLTSSASALSEVQDNAEFLSLFEGEVQNRAFALMFVQREEEAANDIDEKNLWRSYIAFEELNQEKFKPYAEKYKLETKPNFKSRIKARSANLASLFFKETLLKMTVDSTADYVNDLIHLANLSTQKERVFFNYVVEQEKVQVTVLKLLNQNEWREATKVFSDFTAIHKINQ